MSIKILIADDEPHIRFLLEQTLLELEEEEEEEDVELLLVSNGKQALEAIEKECPKMAILDVMMPEMTGFEVCQRVKNDPALKDTYILMLTARGQVTDKKKGEEVGADDYFTKPFDPDLLLDKVREVLLIGAS